MRLLHFVRNHLPFNVHLFLLFTINYPELHLEAHMDTFLGYPRPNGRAGTRNYLAVIPTVFCANEVAMAVARKLKSARPLLQHQGCAQMQPDSDRANRTLISLGANPTVGGVLLIALGCESASLPEVYK